MVASSQRQASEVGVRVLRSGGTAADASVAMDAMLHVTEPASTSLGGDMFALYYDERTGHVTALNASGRSPRNRVLADIARDDRGLVPERHGDAVTVPGVCAGWFDLVARHSRQSTQRSRASRSRRSRQRCGTATCRSFSRQS